MLTRGWALTALTLGLLLANTPWARADEPDGHKPTAQAGEDWIEVYRLTDADCKSVASAIGNFSIIHMVSPDQSTNSLIVQADQAGHEMMERLISKLDMPSLDRRYTTEFLPVKHRDTKKVARLIRDTASRRISTAFDEVSQAIIVSGRPSDIAAARKIVARIDKPQRALTLSFYFIQGTIGNGPDRGASTLPPALRGVAPALSNSGFTDMTLLAPMTTAVQGDSEFTTSGLLDTPDGDRLVFEIEGEVRESATAESAQFTLAARVARNVGDEAIQVFSVETSLTAKLGDYVVLAAAPAQNGENQAMALIVRVD